MEMDSLPQSHSQPNPEQLQPDINRLQITSAALEAHQNLLEITKKVAARLREILGRPLRILDLGCASGFFSLHLAAMGDDVSGVDPLPANVQSCKAQASKLAIKATFIQADIISCLERSPSNAPFDLVLGFGLMLPDDSADNLAAIQQTLQALSRQTAVALIVSPYQNVIKKPLYALPDNPYSLLQPFAYLEQLSDGTTATPTLNQPVFFCSNSYWYANGAIARFDDWTQYSRRLFEFEINNKINPHKHTRRYYFNDTHMMKHYRLMGTKIKSNSNEIQAEIAFLEQNRNKINTLPRLYASNISNNDAWILRDKISGIRLSNAIADGVNFDTRKVVASILQQLALFEQHGFYQNDLRPWNFILSENNNVFLIDYGTVNRTPRDSLSSKKSIYMSFLVLAHEVIHRKILLLRHFSPVYVSISHFPEAYRIWLCHLLSTDFRQWNFPLFLALFDRQELPHQNQVAVADNMQQWLERVEKQLANPKFRIKYFQKYFIKKLRTEIRKASLRQKFVNTFIGGLIPWYKRFMQKI